MAPCWMTASREGQLNIVMCHYKSSVNQVEFGGRETHIPVFQAAVKSSWKISYHFSEGWQK